MSVPKDLRYTKTHEWVKFVDGVATIGITDFAQEQLSDLTYVELPDVDEELEAGDEAAVVESVKAAADVYSPIEGVITEINTALVDAPDAINSDPYGAGWLFKMRPENPQDIDTLLDSEQYEELLPESARE